MARDPSFVHLHLHTHYSLLDGATRIADLVSTAKRMNMPAVAITDHGNLFGAIEFYTAARKAGIKPIIGCELYLAHDHRTRREPNQGKEAFHLLVLAMNMTGYRNLIRLSTRAYTEGFYRKPRVDKELLREHADGLICTSTCLGGEIPQALVADDRRKAEAIADFYLSVFGPERFFIELQDHGIDDERRINPELIDLARRKGVGLVATNDVHYLDADDVEAHDVLCCINTGALITDENRFGFSSGEFYFKSPQQMADLFPDHEEALSNTLRIAGMCDLELDFGKRYAPVYHVPEKDRDLRETGCEEDRKAQSRGNARERTNRDRNEAAFQAEDHLQDAEASPGNRHSSDGNGPNLPHSSEPPDAAYLRKLVYEGAAERYGDISDELRERIDYELSVIISKGFASYFLIVWDFVNYARSRGIPCGARGSGCSSVVTYCLRISHPDPIRYGLYFERFMDPDRDEMPDIDVDICQDGRAEVIEYVRRKYGHVAQIITFNTMKARAAIKDVARVMGVPFDRANELTRLVPNDLHITIDKALEQEPELRKRYASDELTRKVIDISRKLEGLARNAGVHAAGVVVADQPMVNFLPLYQTPKQGFVMTQFDGPTVEKVGLLKMDFLGLRTLSVLERARRLVVDTSGRLIDLEALDLSDPRVYEQFARGETTGIFQFESAGMRDVLRRMRPNRIEDLIAANALYRPGPMAYIDAYIARKHGEPWTTPHPIMTEVLAETYGIMVYQEQVSRLVNRLGNIELKKAFRLAKAISKKKVDQIETFREPFIAGCVANDLRRETANEIFEAVLKFGGYAFNKAHSTGYALVAYQTAWMKAYHPAEFMAALLTYEMGDTAKIAEYREACERMGLTIEPPTINRSGRDFTVERATPGRDRQAAQPGGTDLLPAPVVGQAGRNTRPDDADPNRDRQQAARIRFGLGAIKGLGDKAIEAILSARQRGGPFRDIFDFCERVDLSSLNRAVIEALICAGAFDETGAMRRALFESLDEAIASGQRAQEDRRSGQIMMFGAAELAGGGASGSRKLSTAEWTEAEMLAREKAVLGFYVTKHPLAAHETLVTALSTASIANLSRMADGVEVILGGMMTGLRTVVTKTGRNPGARMGIVTIEDLSGKIEAILFPDDLTTYRPLLVNDAVIFLVGQVDRRRDTPSLRVVRVVPRDQAVAVLSRGVRLTLTNLHQIDALERILQRHRGGKSVFLQIAVRDTTGRHDDTAGRGEASPFPGAANPSAVCLLAGSSKDPCDSRRILLECGRDWRVTCSPEFLAEVIALLGDGAVEIIGPGATPAVVPAVRMLNRMADVDRKLHVSDAPSAEERTASKDRRDAKPGGASRGNGRSERLQKQQDRVLSSQRRDLF